MPFTPYHFGPSGLVGLAFRKWIDIPVFVLANVIVDIEVLVLGLLGVGWPRHRYFHTLLIGTAVGVIWAIAAYLARRFFKKIMQIIRIPYQTGFWKMVVSGVLGVWLHVIIDGIYHYDVMVFWPSRARPLWRLLNQRQVEAVCIACFFAALVPYAIAFVSHTKQNKTKK